MHIAKSLIKSDTLRSNYDAIKLNEESRKENDGDWICEVPFNLRRGIIFKWDNSNPT